MNEAVRHEVPIESGESGAYEDAILGFRNHWYPALLGEEIAENQLKPVTLLGENVLFKRIDGKVYAVRDECLHRGFRFSEKPECYTKNTITCWLHAFTYNFKNGELVAIPSAPNSPLIGQRRIHSYPCEERNGMVFTFIGDLVPPPPLADDVPQGFLDDAWTVIGAVNVPCACNWRIAADSGFDPNHVFIHKDDGLMDALHRPFPLGQRLLGTNPFHSIEERTGPGPKGIIDYLGKAAPVFEYKFECDGEVGHMRSKYPPDDMARRAFESIQGSTWLPCALKVDPWPIL
ncbi:MAG: Rieske 2Fe-2S domain-containing protein, partial [Gammaproteobacteria bacterium]